MKIYNVYQSGKRLYIDEKEIPDNKIVVNKYENEVTTLRLVSDGTLPPRLYWALRNPKLSNKYFILKLVNNEDLIVGTDISATPGLWDMLLIGTPDDYIIEGTDIDQSKLTYISDHFGRLFVRDNFLEELDFEEQTSPTFRVFYDEIMFQLGNKADKKDIPDKMSDLENDTNFISGVAFKDDGEGNVSIVGTTFSGGQTEEGEIPSGSSIEVDDKLDEESTNPVQNKVVTKEIKTLKDKDESLDKEVNTLKEHNTQLKETIEKLQIKVTTEKASFHNINDSANMKVLDFGMEGKTEQETTSGTNLFDEIVREANGLYQLDGSWSASVKYDTYYLYKVKDSNQYIFSSNIGGIRTFWDADGNYLSSVSITNYTSPMTFPEGAVLCKFAMNKQWRGGSEQIALGTTLPPYEPFTNGPSPNPTHPQEIVNAGVYNKETGRYEHKCCVGNRNWFDESKLSNGEFVEFNGVRCYKYTDSFSGKFEYHDIFKENTQYTIIMKMYREDTDAGEHTNITVLYTDGSEQTIKITPDVIKIFTSASGKTITKLYGTSSYSDPVYLDLSVMQIEVGTESTTYTPHASQQITLTSPVPLTKWDKLIKRDGVWGWSIWRRNWTVNGTNWEKYIHDKYGGFYRGGVTPELRITIEGYCNQGRVVPSIELAKNTIYCGNDTLYFFGCSFYDDSLEDKGLANWKAHLNENPLEFWADSDAEQSFIPLPDEEQTLLKNLEMYYGVTNVYNEQGCPMWLCYTCDSKLYVDQKLEQINSALLSLGANV